MAETIKASQLRPGDWFIDPHRQGRRPAKVIEVNGTHDGRVHVTLDDNTKWDTWAASYEVNENLERVGG